MLSYLPISTLKVGPGLICFKRKKARLRARNFALGVGLYEADKPDVIIPKMFQEPSLSIRVTDRRTSMKSMTCLMTFEEAADVPESVPRPITPLEKLACR